MDEHIENNIADVLLNEMWNSNMYILTKNIYGNFRPIPFFVLKQRKQFMFKYVCKIFWRFIVNHITSHYIHIYIIILFCLNFIEINLGLEFRIIIETTIPIEDINEKIQKIAESWYDVSIFKTIMLSTHSYETIKSP